MEQHTMPTNHTPRESVEKFLMQFLHAHREGKIDAILATFAPEMIAYDMMPPLQFSNKSNYREILERYYTQAFQFPVDNQWKDLEIAVSGDLALCYGLYQVKGTFKDSNENMVCWLRCSMGLRQFGGEWKIIHFHNSVPVGDDGRALMELKPED